MINYLKKIYHCKFILSDSGTGQEEPALLKTPVIVPRDYTERIQSVKADCSFMLNIEDFEPSFIWLSNEHRFETEWLDSSSNQSTSELIISKIKLFLN